MEGFIRTTKPALSGPEKVAILLAEIGPLFNSNYDELFEKLHLSTKEIKKIRKAVNLGNDTDTVACVAGSIAGLYYGDIPADWIDSIRNKKNVDKIIDKFSNTICELFEEKRFARIQSQVSQI